MKRLLLAFCGALLLSSVGPLPASSAQEPQNPPGEHKSRFKRIWPHHEKHHQDKSSTTKSNHNSFDLGRHGGPGPAGAGADLKSTSAKVHREKSQRVKTEPLYSIPKTVSHWFHSGSGPGPVGAGAS